MKLPDEIGDDLSRKSTPARLLFVDHTAKLGGGEIALYNLVRHLNPARFTPIVLLFEYGPLAEKLEGVAETYIIPLDERISKARKDSLGLSTLLKMSDAFGLFAFVFRIRRFIVEQHIELVHTNSLKADIIGGLAARLAGRRVIWHVRDRITEDYLPLAVVKAFRLLARLVPTYTIANSNATMRTLSLGRGNSGLSPSPMKSERASVVHDAVGEVPEIRWPGRPNVRSLGLIGRVTQWKGQHIFIRAAAEVHRSHPEAHFYIIGAALFGEQAYESEVRSLVTSLGLAEVVEFTGFCTNVTERIEALDVVVHASITGEPFGQVIIEGMAVAKPVIATDGGGVPEIVVDGETGILVPMGEAQAMAEAMRWMINNPREAGEMGRKGRERVLKQFTIETCASKVEGIFDAVLDK